MPGFTTLRKDYEARYVSDFVLSHYPRDIVKYRCPLGTAPGMWIKDMGLSKALRTYRPYRPEVDAVVITADEILLIEGKIFKVMDGISKLPVYRILSFETPELDEYKTLPVVCILVTPKDPGWTTRVAEQLNVKIMLFTPAWIKDYYEKQELYWTAEERVKRHKRKEILGSLGYK